MPSAPTSGFTIEDRQRLEDLELQVARLISDTQLGRAMTGPVWMDGASIVNGTVSAEKLIVNTLESITVNTGSLNVTGSIKAATSFPAVGARIEINSTGLKGYRNATDTTFALSTDGSGSIGIGSTAMSWTSAGVVSIPKAAIGSLTITDVGSGILGGTYSTAAAGTRVELSTSGIRAYAGTDLFFDLNTTNGTLTLTGNFTVRSAASGQRVQILASGGIAGYYDNTNTAFILNTNGSGRLGPAAGNNSITWDSSGVSIGGVSLSNGKITAQHLSVSQLSAISNDVGLINAGTINAQDMTIQHLKADSITAGTLVADRISGGTLGGSFNIGSGTNISTSGGTLTFGNDYITDNLLAFRVGSTESAMINITSTSASLYSSASLSGSVGNNTCRIALSATPRVDATQSPYNSASLELYNTGNTTYIRQAVTGPGTIGMVEVAKQAGNHPQVTISGHTTLGAPSNQSNLTVNGTVSVTGSITASGSISATGAIAGASVTASGSISATGAIAGASVTATGAITGQFQWGPAHRGNWPSGNYALTRYIQIYDESGTAWGICPVYTN